MLAFVYPGQGSQYVGMGREFLKRYEIAGRIFSQANEILGLNIQKLCLEGPSTQLARTTYLQPAVYIVNMISHSIFMDEIGSRPDFLLGHSLGEYAALTCGEVISLQHALLLIQRRAELMEQCAESSPGMMIAVHKLEKESLESLCEKMNKQGVYVEIACYNTLHQHVLAGAQESVVKMMEELDRLSVSYSTLKVNGAFHSRLMQDAVSPYVAELNSANFKNPKAKIISNITALPYESVEDIKKNLAVQIVKPVRWLDSLSYAYSHGVKVVIELGARPILSKMALLSQESKNILFFDPEHVQQLKETLQQYSIEERIIQTRKDLVVACLAEAIGSKNRGVDTLLYNNQVQRPIRELKQMVLKIKEQNHVPKDEELEEAKFLLTEVLYGKKVTEGQQKEILDYVGMI